MAQPQGVNGPVKAEISGLKCNTLYHFRFKGDPKPPRTTLQGVDMNFTTAACPPMPLLKVYGSQCLTCKAPVKVSEGDLTVSCRRINGSWQQNTISYDMQTPRITVNNKEYNCDTHTAPSPNTPCEKPPVNGALIPWMRADNNNGELVNIGCNIPIQ